jgi:hypothetical protein
VFYVARLFIATTVMWEPSFVLVVVLVAHGTQGSFNNAPVGRGVLIKLLYEALAQKHMSKNLGSTNTGLWQKKCSEENCGKVKLFTTKMGTRKLLTQTIS